MYNFLQWGSVPTLALVAELVDAHILIEVVSYNGSTLPEGEMKRSTSGGFDSPYEKKRYGLDVNAGSSLAQSTWKYLKKASKRGPPSNASIGG